jgi:hypothetical protein
MPKYKVKTTRTWRQDREYIVEAPDLWLAQYKVQDNETEPNDSILLAIGEEKIYYTGIIDE